MRLTTLARTWTVGATTCSPLIFAAEKREALHGVPNGSCYAVVSFPEEPMTVSGLGPIFLLACFGGALAELLKWYGLRESPELPVYARSPFYWALTALMVIAGGGIAVLYGTDTKNAILVVQIGLSAPLLLRALADQTLPREPVSRRGAGYGLRGEDSRWLRARRFIAGR